MSAEDGHGVALLHRYSHRVQQIRGRVLLRPERPEGQRAVLLVSLGSIHFLLEVGASILP
jgi:hypothetical protein